jgi:hypothetical protein
MNGDPRQAEVKASQKVQIGEDVELISEQMQEIENKHTQRGMDTT